MTLTRRKILLATAAFSAAAILKATPARPTSPKRILILGGTGFVGPHNVRHALERGHAVTVFNRGTRAGMFGTDVEELVGDRGGDLSALKGRTWDAVIDESASTSAAPEWVTLSTNLLKDSINHYVYISSRAVYADTSRVPMNSDAPLLTLENSPVPANSRLPYGHAKAYAEKAALAAMPGRVSLLRAGLIVGPGDETDRFTYWPVRLARGGQVLAPGDGSDRVQIIDVRDLAEFCIRIIEDGSAGTFNVIGPHLGQRFDEFVARIYKAVMAEATCIWVDTQFLLSNGVKPYADLPVWQPMQGRTAGWAQFDLTPEIKAGLRFRPLETTARETLIWFRKQADRDALILKSGLNPEREAELLSLWRSRTTATNLRQ